MSDRGENSFAHLPGFGAKLYDDFMKTKIIELHTKEIAEDLVSRITSGRMLVVGTGPGRLVQEIHKLSPNLELFGLDISAAMIMQAKRNLMGTGINLLQGNIQTTDYKDDFFDLIACSGNFYLWDMPEVGLEEIYRILKKGQSAYLYEINKDIDRDEVGYWMRSNFRGENLLIRIVAPLFIMKQLRITYRLEEVEEIVESTSFRESYETEKLTLGGLPAWTRIKLTKHTNSLN
ncbi:MAG: hypothetical protein DRI46_13220 [Chloroflexi bacterium]|nr:MAG: hypothetical protein DRI46_13220 [Chloroflexota bacterium]